jgi:hypothetical protein
VTSKPEFYIFRDARRRVPATELVAALRSELCDLASSTQPDQVNRLLLRAGELECGLRDASALPFVCEQAALLTDLFAEATIAFDRSGDACNSRDIVATASPIVDRISHSQLLELSVPEGFAYYALHPLDYADLVARPALSASSALVVGIRSIGTTLSAVVAARLRQSGLAATRITVRPTGHPYDRICEFDSPERQAIASAVASRAELLICDEGPGRSGSSLLSVAEALEREGVPRSQIHILCSHQPDVRALCARDAGQRWSRYRVAYSGMTRRLPLDAAEYLGGGDWRRKLPSERDEWPATWPQLERLRYSSADGSTILTFEGHGHYGAELRARSQALSDAGFTPPYLGQERGFGRHAVLKGRVARRDDLTPQLLTRMAQYCAWRAREFCVPDVDTADLETMTRVNLEREFGAIPEDFTLPVERPVICDAQMMPHTWLQTASGWLKLDASTHGDDHFFPGPCDIAWDLAGIVVESELSGSSCELLLSKYEQVSGDNASRRIKSYELAYATFRMAWSNMAAASVGDAVEEERLLRDFRRYRQFVQKFVSGVTGQSGVLQPPQIQAQPA